MVKLIAMVGETIERHSVGTMMKISDASLAAVAAPNGLASFLGMAGNLNCSETDISRRVS